jgi:CRP/FNR family cyclic AMP-dependent transcriptional regulator
VSEVTQTLCEVPFFENFDIQFLRQLADVTDIATYPEGSVVFRQGDPAETLHIIVDGNVALEICASGVGCKKILTLTRGDLLGWSPALQQERLTTTARALTEVKTLQLHSHELLAMCEAEPKFGYEFMKRAALALAKRLNATRLQLMNIYGSEMPPAEAPPQTNQYP